MELYKKLFFGIIILFVYHTNAQQEHKKPNILLIISDQHSGKVTTQSGYKFVKTPGVDKLVAEGVAFTRSYCTYPVCMASRASIITGVMPSKSNKNLKRYTSIGTALKNNGYATAYFGKWHVSNTKIAQVEDWHGFEKYKREYTDSKTAKLSIDYIKDSKNKEKPFFLVTSLLNPHDCCELARNISGLGDDYHDGAVEEKMEVDQCPPLPNNFNIPNNEAEGIYTRRTPDPSDKKNYRKHPVKFWKAMEWRQYTYGYDRLVEKMDNHILNIVNALEAQNLLENTIVFYTSDHGDGHGSHEWNQKMNFYEESINVPFVVSWKGKTKSGVIDKETLISSGLDLYPTICKIAGVQSNEFTEGKDISSHFFKDNEELSEDRNYIVSELNQKEKNKPKGKVFVGRMLVTKNYKYFVFDGGENPEQFYDLKNDPGELNSLTKSKEHQKQILAHRQMLKEWIEKTDDNFPLEVVLREFKK